MRNLRHLLLALLSLGAYGARAVETTPAPKDPPAAVGDAGKKGEAENDAGKAQAAAEKFGDWALVCPTGDESKEATKAEAKGEEAPKGEAKDVAKPKSEDCRLVQSAFLNVEGKEGEEPRTQRVMLTAVGFVTEERTLVLSVIVPLGVHLPSGLDLELEGRDAVKMPLQRCDASGCIAILQMDDKLVAALRKGKEGHVVFYNIAGKANRVRLSLDGFPKALDVLSQRVKGG